MLLGRLVGWRRWLHPLRNNEARGCKTSIHIQHEAFGNKRQKPTWRSHCTRAVLLRELAETNNFWKVFHDSHQRQTARTIDIT